MDRIDVVIKLVDKEFNKAFKECQQSINWVALWDLKSEIIGLIEELRENDDARSKQSD